ncbi:MAG: AMP-dependent synthetase/ligase [Treponema sp.]|uniref:AMP-dependent synthetase/ligase n=1 Tax=Treponema sp. TaxID=166 RepID=UPI003FA255F2
MDEVRKTPWAFLDSWRGKKFTGEWPTLPEMFEITVERFPDRNCLTVFEPDRITLTYSQTLAAIQKLAGWLTAHGVKKGTHVAVSGKNSSEWAIVYLSVLYAGGIIIPIDYGLHDYEIVSLLETAAPLFFFVDEEKYPYFLEEAKKQSFIGEVYSLSAKYQDRFMRHLDAKPLSTYIPLQENDTAAILFTSGTMGHPKGVMLSHKNIVSDCYIAQSNLSIFETDVFYALLPLHHSYTMVAVFIESISVGAEIVFGKSIAVSRMLHELKEGKITMLLGVPLLFNKLLAGIMKGVRSKGIIVYGIIRFLMAISYLVKKTTGKNIGKTLFKSVLEKANLTTLRIAISGGGPLSKEVFRAYNEFGIDFVQGYGLTETSPIIALNPKDHFKIESVGRYFHPYMEMKILDPDENGRGEICAKGPMIMQGYYNMPEETAEVLSEDGWFRTGDIGWLDSEKYLYLCGRAKNLIVTSGGKNVYPEEIENAFQMYYNDIEQITVMGYHPAADLTSEEIEVLVYPTDELYKTLNFDRGTSAGDSAAYKKIEEIVEIVNKNLLPYQRITKITLLDTPLEMTTTKKVKRYDGRL